LDLNQAFADRPGNGGKLAGIFTVLGFAVSVVIILLEKA